MKKQFLPPEPFSILVAEDDPDDQDMLQEAFQDMYDRDPLVFVSNGEELLDYLYRNNQYSDLKEKPLPELILLDLNMPKIDGREALKKIKADSCLKKIPVIIFTTSKAEEDISKTYLEGANSYIVKPISIKKLMEITSEIGKYWLETATLPKSNSV